MGRVYMLLARRRQAQKLPKDDRAYGLVRSPYVSPTHHPVTLHNTVACFGDIVYDTVAINSYDVSTLFKRD